MNIIEIKAKLNVSSMPLTVAENAKKEPTDWRRYWNNDNRIAVSLHKDTLAAIKADPNVNLGLQHETRSGDKGAYESYRIVKYSDANVVDTL